MFPAFVEGFRPRLDALDHALSFGSYVHRLLGAEEADLHGLREVIIVLPVPCSVRLDPDVQEVVGRVESVRALAPRILEIDVPGTSRRSRPSLPTGCRPNAKLRIRRPSRARRTTERPCAPNLHPRFVKSARAGPAGP